MQVFRDLTVRGEPDRLAATVAEIDRSLTGGWSRDAEMDGHLAVLRPGVGPWASYRCEDERERRAATLFLTSPAADTLHVANIIPRTRGRLKHEQYNRVVEEFCDRFVRPAAAKTGVAVELTADRADLEDWLSPEAAEKRRRFSASANKFAGACHPSDRTRWNDFVLTAHRDRGALGGSTLRRWLLEEEDWNPDAVEELVAEYDNGRELLAFAERHGRSA